MIDNIHEKYGVAGRGLLMCIHLQNKNTLLDLKLGEKIFRGVA